ncbi:MAG: hypothetical protein AB1760_00050 [Pseudomonadota bacterium]
MARKVFVSGEMSSDDRLIDVDADCPQAVLLWPWLLTAFDDWGRAEANAKKLKAKVFPAVSEVDANRVEEALLAFDKVGLIHLYEVDGKRYMFIDADKWFRWQTHIRAQKRTKDESKIPAPDASAQMRAPARECAQLRADARICTPSPSPSPSPSDSTTTVAAPPGPDDPPDFRRVADEFIKVTGVLCPSANDQTAMSKALKMASADSIIAYMWEVRAKGADKRIKSFSYFLPGIEDRARDAARREAAATRLPPPIGRAVPDLEETRRLVEERLEKLKKVGRLKHDDNPEPVPSPAES